jgi:hypothetical protein
MHQDEASELGRTVPPARRWSRPHYVRQRTDGNPLGPIALIRFLKRRRLPWFVRCRKPNFRIIDHCPDGRRDELFVE